MTATLLTAQDANWNVERGAFNVLVDQQPAGIALPRSADDVSAVVRSAAADGKRVAAQRTGHNAEPLGSLANTVLLRTDGLGGVQIDADAGSARVGAGALWGELVPQGVRAGSRDPARFELQMSASRATHSAVESASTIANTGSPATG